MSINKRDALSVSMFLIWVGWILDLLSTYVGISLGFVESNPMFLLFPFFWMLIWICLAALVIWFKWAPVKVRQFLLVCIILFAFCPSIRNLLLMWEVIM